MNTTKSLSMIVPAPQRDDCNRLMCALGRDDTPLPGRTFSVEMSPNAKGNATHYGCHTYDDALGDLLDKGTVPGNIDWAKFGLTENAARQAFLAIRYVSVFGRESVANYTALEIVEGLKRIKLEEA